MPKFKSPLYVEKTCVSVTLPSHRVRKIDAIAREREVSRSTIVAEAAREYLERQEFQPVTGKVRLP